MNDPFEDRLGTILRARTADAPVSGDLAGGARARRRTTVRRRLALGATAVVLAAATGAVALTHDSPGRPRLATPPADRLELSDTSWIPDGWRAISYEDVEFAVPARFGYGNLSQWCIAQDSTPIVQLPGGASTLVGCSVSGGYGVQVYDTLDSVEKPWSPKGVPWKETVVGAIGVRAVLPNGALAGQIAATAHRFVGADTHGCAPSVPVVPLGALPSTTPIGDEVSVCRYQLQGGNNLRSSELLTGDQIQALTQALDDAASGLGPDAGADQCIDSPETQAVLLRTVDGPVAWVHYDGCDGQGVDLGGTTRELTSDVLTWALSPGWSGGLTVPQVMPRMRPAA